MVCSWGKPNSNYSAVGCCLNERADDAINRSCTSSPTTVVIEQSSVTYIASANYPDRYPIDSHCQWRMVAARPRSLSSIRLTIIDFELDVRRGGRCHDLLRVAASSRDPSTDMYQHTCTLRYVTARKHL